MAHWRKRKTNIVYSTTALQHPPHNVPDDPDEWYRSTPSRSPSIESDVLVPLAQALITGVLIAMVILLLALYSGLKAALIIATGGLVITTLVVWIKIITNYHNMLSTTEEIVKEMSESPSPVTPVEIRGVLKKQSYIPLLRFNLPPGISENEFKAFLRAITSGSSLAMDNWTGSNKLFSRSGYSAVIGVLLAANYIKYKNDKNTAQGYEITENGQESILEFLKQV